MELIILPCNWQRNGNLKKKKESTNVKCFYYVSDMPPQKKKTEKKNIYFG